MHTLQYTSFFILPLWRRVLKILMMKSGVSSLKIFAAINCGILQKMVSLKLRGHLFNSVVLHSFIIIISVRKFVEVSFEVPCVTGFLSSGLLQLLDLLEKDSFFKFFVGKTGKQYQFSL